MKFTCNCGMCEEGKMEIVEKTLECNTCGARIKIKVNKEKSRK